MKSNMGTLDRIIRFGAASVIGILYYFEIVSGLAAAIMASLAGVFLVTSIVSFCPLYPIFNFNTKKDSE